MEQLASSFDGKTVAVMGLGKSGASSARALTAAGARVLAWDDQAESRAIAEEQALTLSDLQAADWGSIDLLVWSPRHSAHPSQAASGGCRGAGRRREAGLRRRAALRRQSGRARHRHHRHQRQIDHHDADRPCAGRARHPGGGGRQSRRPRPRSAGARARRHLCAGTVVLSARTARPGPVRHRGCCSTSPPIICPPWRHGRLCRRQGLDVRPPAGRRHRHRRRGRPA